MLALEIEFLTGRYVASCWNDRDAPEWPPHPARVFSAIVAACHDAGGPDTLERQALEWLQTLPAPAIAASEAAPREVVPVFVPVNDKSYARTTKREIQLIAAEGAFEQAKRGAAASSRELAKLERNVSKKREALRRESSSYLSVPESLSNQGIARARASIPLYRPRKERKFPSVTPSDARAQLVWNDAAPSAAIRVALLQLVSRVTYLGHSSSLVRCSLVDDAHEPTWVPDDAGREMLRIPGPKQLTKLEAAYKVHRGQKPRVLPCQPQCYRRVADACDDRAANSDSGCFSVDWVVFQRIDGPALPIERTVDVASGLREALADFFRHRQKPLPELVSGLSGEKRPLQRPHVAFVALPFVDHAHADGHLMGVAAILPRSIQAADRRSVLTGLGHVKTVNPAAGLLWTLRRLAPALTRPLSLDPARWCRRGSIWATVTPILLDRFPGHLGSRRRGKAARAEAEAKRIVAVACERIGLPPPRAVDIVSLPPFRGVPPSARFRCLAAKAGRPKRVAVHAVLDFGTPVRGPVLLGAGRYLGLGLCLPVSEGQQ